MNYQPKNEIEELILKVLTSRDMVPNGIVNPPVIEKYLTICKIMDQLKEDGVITGYEADDIKEPYTFHSIWVNVDLEDFFSVEGSSKALLCKAIILADELGITFEEGELQFLVLNAYR